MQTNFASSAPSGGEQNDSPSINQMMAPPQRGARPAMNRYNHPLTPAATGGNVGGNIT